MDMKYLLFAITSSFMFSSYYAIGDTVSIEHQNIPLTICHGDGINSTIYLADNVGKITVLGIDATW